MRAISVLIICAFLPRSAHADQACLVEALMNYNRLKTLALAGATSSSVLSAETLVGLRRMEEVYCYRVAYCIVGNPKELESRQIPYAVEFAKCLRDEALEKYEAVPRKSN